MGVYLMEFGESWARVLRHRRHPQFGHRLRKAEGRWRTTVGEHLHLICTFIFAYFAYFSGQVHIRYQLHTARARRMHTYTVYPPYADQLLTGTHTLILSRGGVHLLLEPVGSIHIKFLSAMVTVVLFLLSDYLSFSPTLYRRRFCFYSAQCAPEMLLSSCSRIHRIASSQPKQALTPSARYLSPVPLLRLARLVLSCAHQVFDGRPIASITPVAISSS